MKTGPAPDYFAESMKETEEYWDNKFKQEKKKMAKRTAQSKAPLPYEIPIGIQGEIRRTADELSHEAIFVGIPAETINEALQGLIIRSKS